MGITIYGNYIISFLQHICPIARHIIGSHIFLIKSNTDSLRLTRFQRLRLVKTDQVSRSFLNAAVCIWRVIVDLHHIFACHVTSIGHSHIKGNISAAYSEVTHFLGKCGIGKPIAKRILYDIVIINKALIRCRLIVLISNVDSFHIIGK